MRQVIISIVRIDAGRAGVSAATLTYPTLSNEPDKHGVHQDVSGYVLEQPTVVSPDRVMAWGYFVVTTSRLIEPEPNIGVSVQPRPNGASSKMVQLQLVGRLVPLAAPSNRLLDKQLSRHRAKGRSERDTVQQHSANPITLRPVQSGQSYRITSPPRHGLVRPELANALETVFQHFSREHGFSSEKPLEISLSRGYKANSHGHKEGRAADIVAVGGKSLSQWKQAWDRALAAAEKLADPGQQAEAIAAEQRRNLGYGLYKALQAYGGWRVNPKGWRVYRHVMQIFGPWTATEGPWKALQIENPTPEERQRLADQSWVFQAHQDHIHVAR